jgi:hypothetical protein
MRSWQALVLLVFGALTVNCGLRFGTEWEIGRLGMPSTMLAADGKHHPNGDEVEAMTLSLARSGYEQEVYLGIFGMVAVLDLRVFRHPAVGAQAHGHVSSAVAVAPRFAARGNSKKKLTPREARLC